MWTELKNCRAGDYIKAYFLGNRDPSDSSDYNWHQIYEIYEKPNGHYYAKIEDWRGDEVYGSEDVYVKD